MSTTSTTTHSGPTTSPRRAGLPVWGAGAVAGLAASAVLLAYGALVEAIGVPMLAGSVGAPAAEAITPASFAIGTLICTFWGTLLAILLARWAARPARTFVVTTLILLTVSLAFPAMASHAVLSTKVALVIGHLVAGAVVIPLLGRRLSHTGR